MPRWTPPVRNALEHRTSLGGRTLSSPIKIPENAIKDGLITKDGNTCNSAADPTAGTPDGMLFSCSDLFLYNFA